MDRGLADSSLKDYIQKALHYKAAAGFHSRSTICIKEPTEPPTLSLS